MKQVFVNNFAALVAQTFGIADTSLYLNSAAGLPALTGGDYLLLTVYRKTGVEEREHEVIKATAITGNMLTVVRSVEGAAASQFLAGDYVEARVTAGAFDAISTAVTAQLSAQETAIAYQLAAQNTAINTQLAAQDTQVANQLTALSALVYAAL